jgi:drug/metabolite transporter (DMT)-like permease
MIENSVPSNRSWKAHWAVLLTNIFFGANFTAVQYIAKKGIPPFGLNVIRVAISSILFWLMLFVFPQKKWIKKKDIPRFLVCAITGVVINQMLFIKGLTLTLSIHAALLMLVTPIFITFIAAWLGRERITIFQLAGLALAISGSVVLILQRESTGGGTNIIVGNILVILNAISYAFYFVLVKPLMKEYHPFEVIRWIFTLGTPFMLLIGWKQFTSISWESLSMNDYLVLAGIVFLATFLAYLFNLYGITVLGASVTGSYIYSQPVFAAIFAIALTEERLTLYKIIAAALIVCGLLLVNKHSNSIDDNSLIKRNRLT